MIIDQVGREAITGKSGLEEVAEFAIISSINLNRL